MGNISPTMMVIGVIAIFVLYSVYNVWKLKDQIFCTLIRKDKTTVKKFAKVKQQKIDLDGGWYDLDIGKTTLNFVWQGVIPTWIRCLFYRYNSRFPLDPADFTNNEDNPNDRKALDKTDDLAALLETQKNALSKPQGKKSLIDSLFPIIMIAGVAFIAYTTYREQSMINSLGLQGNVTQQQLLDIAKQLQSLGAK